MRIEDLLIDFDEMGFAPTTLCENPEKYACEWKSKLITEIEQLKEENEKLKADNQILKEALAYMADTYGFRMTRSKIGYEEIEYPCNHCVVNKELWDKLKRAEEIVNWWEE